MKLAVCTPWSSPFMFTRFLDGALAMECPPGVEIRWIRGVGWCPARMHNDMFERALAWDAEMICVLGADQVHPPDLFSRLLALQAEGHDVVSALVPTREAFDGHAAGERLAWRREGKDPVQIDPAAGAVQRIDFIGSGVLLFPAALLRKISKPWLSETITGENYQRVGNCDCRFVWKLQAEAGAEVWVDTTIEVEHLNVEPLRPSSPAEEGKSAPFLPSGSARIHPLAVVHPTAWIGDGTRVWQFATVLAEARIGASCSIGAGAEIGVACSIGDGSRIGKGVFLPARSRIGRRVFIGPGAVFTDDRHPRASNPDYCAEPPVIESGANIGAAAVVLPGVRIHSGATVGAGAVVTKDVRPELVVVGNPAHGIGTSGEGTHG